MTQAVTVRRDGDTFQARHFWHRAARLLDPQSPVIKVGFETGPRSFDDIWVEYDPDRSPTDQRGAPLRREHIQCKWHVTPSSYGYAALVDPEFINANARSLLQRAHAAQESWAPSGEGVRFRLLTNWRIDRDDPLREIVGTRSGTLRLDRFDEGLTDRSRAGRLRSAWRDHLQIDDEALRRLAGTLAFAEANDTLDDCRDTLDPLFGMVGLRRIPVRESAFIYDDLVFQWMAQGRQEFDRQSFKQACDQEGLLSCAPERTLSYGVKSFEHPIDPLQDRCVEVLDLTPAFEQRFIRSEADWSDTLYPSLKGFLMEAATRHERLRLALDAHTSLAFAAGSVLDVKSGRAVEIEQRTGERRVWAADDADPDPCSAGLAVRTQIMHPDRPGMAVAIGLTHDIAADVSNYVQEALPDVGRLVVVEPSTGPGSRAVQNGRHAADLADATVREILRFRAGPSGGVVHLFVAAPNAFVFFLGQRRAAMGRVSLYEFDFEGGRDRSYRPSLNLP